ncbi:MAG: signal peptidase I [Gemmatimonadota bacterium]|nr:signal peptidase I [Gemmatimonadota bacterium]
MATRSRSKPSSRTNVVRDARGKKPRKSGNLWQQYGESLRSIAFVIVVWLFIRTFFVEAFRIPSGSMEPTLLVGDFLFVNKLVFGPHIPLTSIRLPGYGDPRRGDVVVYTSPYQAFNPQDPTPTVVKRVVGVGGDTLYMRQGLLYLNGIAQRQGYAVVPDPNVQDQADPIFDWQKKVGLQNSRFGPAPKQPTHDNWGPFVVPLKHIFTMGDNRYNSIDARYYGFVPRENVWGRPIFIYFSIDTDAWSIRWSRIGHTIH